MLVDKADIDHVQFLLLQKVGTIHDAFVRIKTVLAGLVTAPNNARAEISLCGYSGDCGFKGDNGSCNWRHPFCKYRETSPVA